MKTIRNYNALRLASGHLMVSIALVIPSFLIEILTPNEFRQGIDLTESFFINTTLSQFSHLSWRHLGLNALGLLIVTWGLAVERPPAQWLFIALISLLATPVWLTWIEPLAWYCGLSGALHAQFTTLLVLTLIESPKPFQRSWPLWLMAVGLVIKLGLEFTDGQAIDPSVGGPIAYEAHRGGVAWGLCCGLLIGCWGLQHRSRRR